MHTFDASLISIVFPDYTSIVYQKVYVFSRIYCKKGVLFYLRNRILKSYIFELFIGQYFDIVIGGNGTAVVLYLFLKIINNFKYGISSAGAE